MTDEKEIKYIFNSKNWTRVIYGFIYILSLLLSSVISVIFFSGYDAKSNVSYLVFLLCCVISIYTGNYLFLNKYFYTDKNICILVSIIAVLFPMIISIGLSFVILLIALL